MVEFSFSYVLGFSWFGEASQLSWRKTDFWKKKRKKKKSWFIENNFFQPRLYSFTDSGWELKSLDRISEHPVNVFAKLFFFLAQMETDSFFQ